MKPTLAATLAALIVAHPTPPLQAQDAYPTRKLVAVADTLCCMGLAEPASGRFVVFADPLGIHIADERTGKITSSIDHMTAPVAHSGMYGSLSISASGRRLAFLASGEPNEPAHVWSVDLDSMTGKPVSTPHRVSIAPAAAMSISDDGRWIAFVTPNVAESGAPAKRQLVTMPSDGGDERVLDTAMNIQSPRWSPDGKIIYYIRGRGHGPGLARIAASGGEPDSLTPAMSLLGVSADGQSIAYYPYSGDNRPIVSFADPHGKVIATVAGSTHDWFLTSSRSRPATLLGRRGEWPTALKIVSLAGASVSSFALNDRFASGARFSPDGRRLAAISLVDGREQIIIYDPGTNQRRLLRTTAEPLNWAPDGPSIQWSPDGSHIAFLALDSTFTRHEIYVVDVATSRSTRLADLGPARWSNATLFRWRSDGQAIDYIHGASALAVAPSLERVTLTGQRSTVTTLPAAVQGNGTDGGYRLLNDSLIAIGRNPRTDKDSGYLAIVDARTGVTRTVIPKGAYWNLSDNSSILSPDGKWVAFGSRRRMETQTYYEWTIASLDGKAVRVLGNPIALPCMQHNFYGQSLPNEWLPDSRGLIVKGVPSCESAHQQVYIVPIDGTPARHVPIPTAWDPDITLTPDGHSLLAATINGGSMNIVAVDMSKALAPSATQAGKLRKAGRN
jgi:Tol biopolymer transport system component